MLYGGPRGDCEGLSYPGSRACGVRRAIGNEQCVHPNMLFAEKVGKISGSNDRARGLLSSPRCLVVLWIQESVFTLVFAGRGTCRARCFRESRSSSEDLGPG